MTALTNQPEAFALDLGDDQSRYLWIKASYKPKKTRNGLVDKGLWNQHLTREDALVSEDEWRLAVNDGFLLWISYQLTFVVLY